MYSMSKEEWAEEHGYRRGHCPIHGSFWTDGDGCEQCYHEPEEGEEIETLCRVTKQVARKTYHARSVFEIRPGDTYRRTVRGGYVVGGPRWLTVSRKLIAKGPAGEAQAA